MTSLLPLDHGAVAFRFPGNHYAALPRVLTEHGYTTLSAVAFEPGFWNRQVMHPAYGFQRSLFEPDFQMTEQIGWGLNDRDFLQQMVPRLEKLPRPFARLADHPVAASSVRGVSGSPQGAEARRARRHVVRQLSAHDALLRSGARGFQGGARRAIGCSTTASLVVFGDHDAGFARDAALARTLGIAADSAAWALNDRVPLFIRAAAVSRPDALVGERLRPAGQTDFAPTLLALLGIDPAPLPYLGRNLLGAADDRPVPRPYGDWLDAHHLFLAGDSAPCYDLRRRAAAAPAACADADARSRRARELSRLIVVDDLQQALRTRLAAGPPP